MSKSPQSLYLLALEQVSKQPKSKVDFQYLSEYVLVDYFHLFYVKNRFTVVMSEFVEYDNFYRLLKVKLKRHVLLKCFQMVLNQSGERNISEDILKRYKKKYCKSTEILKGVDEGLAIGTFFNESGQFKTAVDTFNVVESLCKKLEKNDRSLRRLLDCYFLRINVEVTFCLLKEAKKTFELANETIEELRKINSLPNLAPLYASFSYYYGMRSEYDNAYEWSKKAMELLTEELSERAIVNVLRLSSRALIFKRYFTQASYLIKQAVVIAEELYRSDCHPCYSNVLMDYGMFLLNNDDILECVSIYRKALNIRQGVFKKGNNMWLASSYEDLAYALYVKEYNTGQFSEARELAEKAIQMMDIILPKDHLMLASTKRVKALILEEMALDSDSFYLQKSFLETAELLHKSALELSLAAFGEHNVQTAKHYGNLGRLYQSMELYEKAEQMHLKAIKIKEELLGESDYEVGLSVGHLASLYTFHMERYTDAEGLYLRSIGIALKLYGNDYSGLEYDYRGLIHVYTNLNFLNQKLQYLQIMNNWTNRREFLRNDQRAEKGLVSLPLETVKEKFFAQEIVVT